jgi:hypothetical protein
MLHTGNAAPASGKPLQKMGTPRHAPVGEQVVAGTAPQVPEKVPAGPA